MERQFREISEFVRFLKLNPLLNCTDRFMRDLVNFDQIVC